MRIPRPPPPKAAFTRSGYPSARAERMTRLAISARWATRSRRIGVGSRVMPSHPEDAEAAATLDHVGVHGRQREAEHGARVARVDHAVVVDLAGVEERVGLP